MITSIEALHYRCLKYVSQPLDRFHVLVGPNASGKTTFLDTIAFLGSVVGRMNCAGCARAFSALLADMCQHKAVTSDEANTLSEIAMALRELGWAPGDPAGGLVVSV